MKKLILCLSAWGLSLCLPAQSDDSRWTPADIIHTEYARETAFSPDGKMLVWPSKRKANP